MTIADQLKLMRDVLSDWARDNGSSVEVASDAVTFIDHLRSRPGGSRVAILFDSESPRGEHDILGRVDRRFLVGVGRGRGLNLDRADSIMEGSATGKPLAHLVEEVREVLRGLRFPGETTEGAAEYLGIERLDVPGMILDAYTIRIQIGIQIPEQLEED